ncbi:hypothetical protein ACHAWT_006510 [Skeletonema menzelii]
MRLFTTTMPYSSISSSAQRGGGAPQLSPFLAAFIIALLHNPQLTCQAWTNTPLLLSSTPTRLQQQTGEITGTSTTAVVVEHIISSQSHRRWNRLKIVGRRRSSDTTTPLFASDSHNDHHDYANGDEEDEASIMEIADALISTTATTQQQQPANNKVNGFVQKAQQAWTSPALNDASNTNPNNNDIDANTYKDEEAKYLTLAKEAWNEFFSDQLTQEEFLTMALDAWRDNAASLTSSQLEDGSEFVEVMELDDTTNGAAVEEQQQVESHGEEEVEINGSQSNDTTFVGTQKVSQIEQDNAEPTATTTTTTEQKWGLNAGMSFLSGLFSGSKQQSDDDDAPADTSGENEDLPYGLRMKDSSLTEEKNEEELPYGLRVKSPSASSAVPKSSSPAPVMDETTTREKGGDDAVNGNSSSMKAKQLGGTQVTPPISSKGFTPPPLKSLNKKQVMPPPPPMNKGVVATPPMMNKGVIKGKENSFSRGGNKLSSAPPSPLLKKGNAQLGIKSKFAPKTLDMTTKKRPQGSRGGLSFLKSDKLSKDYEAEKNYNPMNKGVTVDKLKGLKIGQEKVGASKSVNDVEASSKANEKADTSKATSSAVELPPATTLISEGMTADEAEIVRKNRLLSEKEISSLLKKVRLEVAPVEEKDAPTGITEGMTAEEALRARMARLEISDRMKEKIKTRAQKKGGVGTMPIQTIPLKGPTAKKTGTLKAVPKVMPLKGGISTGAKESKQSGKGLPFLKKSPSIVLDSTVKSPLPPLPLKEVKSGSSLPPLAKATLGDAVTKKGFPPPKMLQKVAAPLPMKGPVTEAAPNFSEKKTLQPLSLKGKGDDAGLKKGLPLPPLAKKSFGGDGASAMKKGFPSTPLPLKGAASPPVDDPLSKSENEPPTSDVNEGLSLNGEKSDSSKSNDKTTKPTPKESVISEVRSKATDLTPATPLISSGMTADEAERIRMNRLLTEEGRASKSLDDYNETALPQDTTLTAITEGMTAEEAERARMARDTTTIDLAALQSRIRQLNDTAPTTEPRPTQNSKSTDKEEAELKQLKETAALLKTKLDGILRHIDNLESKLEVLDQQNLQLRRDNEELREELDELKRTVALMDCLNGVGQ